MIYLNYVLVTTVITLVYFIFIFLLQTIPLHLILYCLYTSMTQNVKRIFYGVSNFLISIVPLPG